MTDSKPVWARDRDWDATGLDYPGSGIKCDGCGRVGTYYTCAWCGNVIVDKKHGQRRYHG